MSKRTGHWCGRMEYFQECVKEDGVWIAREKDYDFDTDGDSICYVNFCPWCGQELDVEKRGGL